MVNLSYWIGTIRPGFSQQIEVKPYLQIILTNIVGQVYLAYTPRSVNLVYDDTLNKPNFATTYDHRQAFTWERTEVIGPNIYSELEKRVHNGTLYYYGARYVTYDSTDVTGSVGVSGSVDITATKAIPVSGTVTIETDKALDVHFNNTSIEVTATNNLPVDVKNASIPVTGNVGVSGTVTVDAVNTTVNVRVGNPSLDVTVSGSTVILNTNLTSIGGHPNTVNIDNVVPVSGTVAVTGLPLIQSVNIESYGPDQQVIAAATPFPVGGSVALIGIPSVNIQSYGPDATPIANTTPLPIKFDQYMHTEDPTKADAGPPQYLLVAPGYLDESRPGFAPFAGTISSGGHAILVDQITVRDHHARTASEADYDLAED